MQEFPTELTAALPGPGTVLVVAAALIAADGRICLQQRPLDKAHGGLWEFPGGKVEPGEHPRAALAREIEEELGVRIAPEDMVAAGFADSPAGEGAGLCILLYAVRQWSGEAQCLEGEAIGWYRLDDIAALPMPPLDYPLAEGLGKLLSTSAI